MSVPYYFFIPWLRPPATPPLPPLLCLYYIYEGGIGSEAHPITCFFAPKKLEIHAYFS